MSGPPESPGWMLASVCTSPVRVWTFEPSSSDAVICWFFAVTDPDTTIGIPP